MWTFPLKKAILNFSLFLTCIHTNQRDSLLTSGANDGRISPEFAKTIASEGNTFLSGGFPAFSHCP